MRRPSMTISPLSGIRKPATRLSSVVLPQPDGPSSVISSPRRTISDTSSSAVILPKRLVTRSSWTAACWLSVQLAGAAIEAESSPSAGLLDVENLCQAKEQVGEYQQRCGDPNVYDRDRSHRGIGVFAHVVVKRDRQRLRALRRDEQRSGKFIERQDRREQPAADQSRQQQRQGDGGEDPPRRCAKTRGGELQMRIEVAQRDIHAAQHERQ